MADGDNPVVKDGGSKEANEKLPKKGILNGKNKWYVIGGLAVVAVLVFIFVKKSNTNSGSVASTTAANNGIDPATGYLSGSPADTAALGGGGSGGGTVGTTGPQGSPGPAGPAGPAGPSGTTGATGATGTSGSTTKTGGSSAPSTGTTKPLSTFSTYTVQAGDTLASLASKFGVSVGTLAHANTYVSGEVAGNAKVGQPLGTGAGLKTGQVLKIPNRAALCLMGLRRDFLSRSAFWPLS